MKKSYIFCFFLVIAFALIPGNNSYWREGLIISGEAVIGKWETNDNIGVGDGKYNGGSSAVGTLLKRDITEESVKSPNGVLFPVGVIEETKTMGDGLETQLDSSVENSTNNNIVNENEDQGSYGSAVSGGNNNAVNNNAAESDNHDAPAVGGNDEVAPGGSDEVAGNNNAGTEEGGNGSQNNGT